MVLRYRRQEGSGSGGDEEEEGEEGEDGENEDGEEESDGGSGKNEDEDEEEDEEEEEGEEGEVEQNPSQEGEVRAASWRPLAFYDRQRVVSARLHSRMRSGWLPPACMLG